MPSLIAYLQLGHETDCVGKYALLTIYSLYLRQSHRYRLC